MNIDNSEDNKEKEFYSSIRKLKEHRIHKIINSYGIKDYYNYYKSTYDSDYPITQSQYSNIIRRINILIGEEFLQGNDIILPCRLGRIEIRKYKPKIIIDYGKIKTNYSIDWNRTLKLWFEDEESRKNKTLVKIKEEEIFKIYYNRIIANYTNKSFYEFSINRKLKRELSKKIKNKEIDTYELGKTTY